MSSQALGDKTPENSTAGSGMLFSNFIRILSRFSTMIILGLPIYYINPLGFFTYTKDRSLDFFNYIVAPELPMTWSEEITTIIVDNQFVNQHSSWPLPYIMHARVLKKILTFNPRAVFVNFVFSDDRSYRGIVPLILVLREYKSNGIPIFLTSDEKRSGIPDFIEQLVTPVTSRIEPSDIDYNTYYLFRQGTVTHESPVVALIKEYCSKTPSDPTRHQAWAAACNKLLDHSQFSLDKAPMILLWGTKSAGLNTDKFRCNSIVGENWQQQIINWFSINRSLMLQSCPRYPTLLLDNLLGGFSREDLNKYLTDKIVLYGAEIQGDAGWVAPPTHRLISETYTHATALENLFIFGNNYFVGDRVFFGVSLQVLLEIVMWIIVCLIISFDFIIFKSIIPSHSDTIAYRFLFDISSISLLLCLGVFINALYYLIFKIAPVNFIGIIAILFIIPSMYGSEYFRKIECIFQKVVWNAINK